ncbi:MAG: hypothetical protein GFH27_549287n142 [Chloroflexi bacterium AL-W]|nr:hypothetical protein [Chloroflexi bacterium AL-N1]NOK66416.1 hypothetical protein [Chloroflexi bacterium AL-N10]NOK71804.1 hypothetical protein [Chloroflexi bacterium AL-N5]NOK81061.1 hypothetical protein [Chloroflexi bacterium AL-W]NOK89334.1 hypothetical protein [Chloroflexi bacterium AL-N15]
MSDFLLIDLSTQNTTVKQHMQRRPREYILAWLCQLVEVYSISSPYDTDLYGFCSSTGMRTGFRLAADSQIILLEEHTTIT